MQARADLSIDTQAVLLLCGYFGKSMPGAGKPLSVGEYGRLTKWLLERQRRPGDLLRMPDSELAPVVEARLEVARVRELLGRGAALALATEKWLRSGLWVLSRSDESYPKRLKKRFGIDAPPVLYGAGDQELLSRGGLAIVGSRNATEAALAFTQAIAARCGSEGLAVISGGARGIDSAAMQAAGEAGGGVVGVLADSLLDAVRNRQNRLGIEAGRLVLVSPFYPDAGFNAGNAMARNRYIYALADWALVVQSDLSKGGTWAGAVEDLREGWVPLYVRGDPEAKGNAALVRQGARSFDFDLGSGQSLRAYFEAGIEQPQPRALLPLDERAPARAEEAMPVYEVPAAPQAATAESPATSDERDLFGEFLRRLDGLLARGPMSQKEIAVSLSLETAQAKVWLKRAEEEGKVVARGKGRKYELAGRGLFQT